MTEKQKLIRSLFAEALDFPEGEQRAAFVSQVYSADQALGQELEELVQAASGAARFLPGESTSSGAEALRCRIAEAIDHASRPPGPGYETAGDRIGRYKLIQQIGEGGCGVVYLAEQEEPVRRRVALKVIKLGMDTRQVVARFEAERQALALMDHPGIAKVLDGGSTAAGRPFFVMEWVRGTRITEYCDTAALPIRSRLELFTQVCHAIQHAHQKGIIHRDLKPSNLLVSDEAGVATPKVIDFGIAKAIGEPLTDQTAFTLSEQLLGTPAYMSPEQAAIGAADIDTRADIYSLGVLLYELLTGKTPFATSDLLNCGLDELRRTIREKEPLRPSARLQSLAPAELALVASKRRTGAAELLTVVRGELDWIVLKCLEKDRTRRYDTAYALAADVKRYLENQPVSAAPSSRVYELQKFIRRNKGVFAAGAVVVAALLISLGTTTALLVRERQLRIDAELRELNLASLQLLGQGRLAEAEASRRKVLVVKERLFGHDHLEVATAMSSLAEVLRHEHRFAEAERVLRESIAIRQQVAGKEDASVAAGYTELGELFDVQGKLGQAEEMFRESLRLRTGLGPDNLLVPDALYHLGLVLWKERKLVEAESSLRNGLLLGENLPVEADSETALIAHALSRLLREEGRLSDLAHLWGETLPRFLNTWPGDLNEELTWLTDVLLDERKEHDLELLFQRIIPSRIENRARGAAALRARGSFHARVGRFSEAAVDFDRAASLDEETSYLWYCLGTLLAQCGERESYRVACKRALATVTGNTSGSAAEQLAKTCLLLSDPAIDLATVSRLADTAVAASNTVNIAWYEITKGLTEYRQGHFTAALDWGRRASGRPNSLPDREALADALLAMAYHNLRQDEQAQGALQKSFELVGAPNDRAHSRDLGRDWVDRVYVWNVAREAQATLPPTRDKAAGRN